MSPPPAERDRIFFIAVSLVLNATNTSFAFGKESPYNRQLADDSC